MPSDRCMIPVTIRARCVMRAAPERRSAMPSLNPGGTQAQPNCLAESPGRYRRRVLMLALELSVFFITYFGAVLGCILVLVWPIAGLFFSGTAPDGPPGHVSGLLMFQLALCAPALSLLPLLVRFIIPGHRRDGAAFIEIAREDQPRLFDCIERVCDEAAAPYPTRVFVNHEVNARVFPGNASARHPLTARGKNLLIGLGLLNALDCSEFKAVLAHEAGHLAQKSLWLVALADVVLDALNRMIERRGLLDRWLDRGRRHHPLVAFPAHGCHGIRAIVRWILANRRSAILVRKSDLTRQLEMDADSVAVRVAGSDALCRFLDRARNADQCLASAVVGLTYAYARHVYTSDLFYHQACADELARGTALDCATKARRVAGAESAKPRNAFRSSRSPPPESERKQLARMGQDAGAEDSRSPWLLFNGAERLRIDVTRRFYQCCFRAKADLAQTDAKEVQAFIDAENVELFRGSARRRKWIVG
jgi:Zn-dependent protease with chaperone function